MNRKAKRASAANPVSRIEALEAENQALRDAYFAIVRSLGRVRVMKREANAIGPGDSVDVRDLGDAWMFEFKPSNMVVPGGVANGQAPPEAG